MKFLTLPLTKREERERGAKTYPISKTSILKLLKNCHWSDPDKTLKNKNWF